MADYNGQHLKGEVDSLGVLHIRMSRGPVNAFAAAQFSELGYLFGLAKEDGNVRAIVLSSAFPKYFTAGLDLKAAGLEQQGSDTARKALRLRDHVLDWQAAITQIEACDKPVIAAVSGIAYGLAVDICCACDIRYAASDAQFSIKEVDIGIAADIGTLSRLPKIIGNESLARELALTARPFGADEALKMGFVSRVLEGGHQAVVEAALATARIIATKSPIAVLGTKHLMNYSRDHTVAEGLNYTAIWNASMVQTADLKEAMGSFLHKTKPRFSKL